jgi:hypothetical protein
MTWQYHAGWPSNSSCLHLPGLWATCFARHHVLCMGILCLMITRSSSSCVTLCRAAVYRMVVLRNRSKQEKMQADCAGSTKPLTEGRPAATSAESWVTRLGCPSGKAVAPPRQATCPTFRMDCSLPRSTPALAAGAGVGGESLAI